MADLKKFAEDYLGDLYEYQTMTEEQKKLKEYQEKLAKYEEQEKIKKEEEETKPTRRIFGK